MQQGRPSADKSKIHETIFKKLTYFNKGQFSVPLIKTVIDNKCSVAQTRQITRIRPCLCPLFYWRTNIVFLLGEVKSERKRKFKFVGQLLGARSRGKMILPGTLWHGAPNMSHLC